MPEKLYGAHCHLCGHIEHRHYPATKVPWLTVQGCETCRFCQENALWSLIKLREDLDFNEVRPAIAAFRRGEDHPLLDSLKSSLDPSPDPQWVDPEWLAALESFSAVEDPGTLADYYHNDLEEDR